jgi:hypothetical protein
VAFVPIGNGQSPATSDDKVVRIGRTATPPKIDGFIDESEWSAAASIEDFHQLTPIEYAPPSEETRIKVMYDDDALYVAAYMFNKDPSQISARVLKQGDALLADDRVALVIDTFHDRRNGYLFMVNSNGVRRQGLYQNTTNLNWDWKGIWHTRTQHTARGWTAEFRIPFKTLAFDPNNDRWGLNFQRWIPTRNESIGWSSRNAQVNPSTAGTAVGLGGLSQGVGLDVVPSARMRREKRTPQSSDDWSFKPSLDVFYRPTPTLTGALTLNTDFSATDVDDRQVNLTRFSLFFPEKRTFFLEGADFFEFARLDASNDEGSALPTATRQNGRPFFSRTIGLGENGEAVDILAGAKLTGRIGRWNVGFLDVQQDEVADIGSRNLFVGRAAMNVLEESSVGAILTHGNPRADFANTVAGVDLRYRNSRLPGGKLLEGEAWYQLSRGDSPLGDDDDDAFGLRVRLPNTVGWRGGLSFKELGEHFRPALGFVNRRGIRDYTAELGYTRRLAGGIFQTLYAGVDAQQIDRLQGGLDSRLVVLRPLEIETRRADAFKLRGYFQVEALTSPFTIAPGVVIAPGRYEFDELEIALETAMHRQVSASLTVAHGDFYDGEQARAKAELRWRPSPHFAVIGAYEINDIDLPAGAFISRLMRLRLDVVFSSTLAWTNFIQYDNVSELIGINSRLHWIPETGREMYVVVNQGLEDFDGDNRFHKMQSDVVVKAGYTFRF